MFTGVITALSRTNVSMSRWISAVVLSLAFACSDAESVPFRGNDGRSGAFATTSAKSESEPVWTASVGSRPGPPILVGPNVVVANQNGGVHAFGLHSGQKTWSVDLARSASGAVTSFDAGVLVSTDGGLVAVNTAGSKLWEDSAGAVNGAALPFGGLVVSATLGGDVRAVAAASGELVWRATAPTSFAFGPVAQGDSIVVGGRDGRLYGLDPSSGDKRWDTNLDGAIRGFAADGRLSVAAGSAVITYDLASSAEPLWRVDLGAPPEAPPNLGFGVVVIPTTGLAVVDAASGEVRATLSEPLGSVTGDVALTPGRVFCSYRRRYRRHRSRGSAPGNTRHAGTRNRRTAHLRRGDRH